MGQERFLIAFGYQPLAPLGHISYPFVPFVLAFPLEVAEVCIKIRIPDVRIPDSGRIYRNKDLILSLSLFLNLAARLYV